jgi:hypothetical protein
MADWKGVAETSKKIAKETDRVDILINDAARGIMTYQLTDYGVDRHSQSNPLPEMLFLFLLSTPELRAVSGATESISQYVGFMLLRQLQVPELPTPIRLSNILIRWACSGCKSYGPCHLD